VFKELSTEAIVQGCQAEATRPRTEESGYCFELFRRALEEEEPAAWLAIERQYRQLILRWGCDCAPDMPSQEVEQTVTAVWLRFWQALAHPTEPFTRRFGHIGAVLSYLKQCTASVLLDHKRHRQRLDATTYTLPVQDATERLEQEQLLQQVRRWIRTSVTDAQEQLVLYLSYQAGLSPAEIAARYPQEFPDAHSVRRIKERILKRARRALRQEATEPASVSAPE
jgi:DNA-directed RNA polymerase specialized sigma24 family protein